MPVSDNIVNMYLQLGIAGATLLILLVIIILLFKYLSDNRKSKSSTDNKEINRIDKLCDKIDALISSNAEHTQKLNEVLLSNDKDQETTIKLLDQILVATLDTQRRVVRIDDRTYHCLGEVSKEAK